MPQKNKNRETNNTAETPLEEQREVPQQDMEQAPPEPDKTELELLQKKYDDISDRYLRLMAEYDNYRKRTAREKDDMYQNATCTAVAKFLPVLDNFERAEACDKQSEEFAKGFAMIYTGFREVLASLGVEAFGETGETFDPELHNAVMHIEDESLGQNVITQVLQKGYKVGGRVVRHAMVQTAN